MKKISSKALIEISIAVLSGVAAFYSTVVDQKQANLISTMEKRITLLEKLTEAKK